MRYWLFAILVLIIQKGLAQNLVPNPSFEEYSQCPSSSGQIALSTSWYSSSGSPDYYNFCSTSIAVALPCNLAGCQNSHSGQAHTGLGTYDGYFETREMMGCKLISKLEFKKVYCIELYVCKADNYKYSSNNIGLFFSNDSLNFGNYNYTLMPSVNFTEVIIDSVHWIKLESIYVANGDEKYLTIGNFLNNTNTIVQQTNFNNTFEWAYYFIDDVSIYECDKKDIDLIKIFNVFTPNNDGVNDAFEIQYLPQNSQLYVYSRWGNIVYQSNSYNNDWTGENLNDGVYYYVVTLPSGNSTKGTLTILRD